MGFIIIKSINSGNHQINKPTSFMSGFNYNNTEAQNAFSILEWYPLDITHFIGCFNRIDLQFDSKEIVFIISDLHNILLK